MFSATLSAPDDVAGWRVAARAACAAAIPPSAIDWRMGEEMQSLFARHEVGTAPAQRQPPRVPAMFIDLAERALLHSHAQRFALAYSVLFRLQEDPALMSSASDREVAQLVGLAKAVRRDMHKMTAFVRFRQSGEPSAPVYVAWFEPDHHILRATVPFFVNRFAGMRWSILTPKGSAHWTGSELHMGAPAMREDAPSHDELEDLWRQYYASIFNPARLMPRAMRQQMPRKYWKNLPEASLIAPLIQAAQGRENDMIASVANPAAKRRRPAESGSADGLANCRRCPLHGPATQAIAGTGRRDARLVLVGEQPGDEEDLTGKPFVGPAGMMLDAALARAGIRREDVYLTNAVKHFKFVPHGRRRIHQKPGAGEITACRMWLDQELDEIGPVVVLALGATAALSLTGRMAAVAAKRGTIIGQRAGADVMLTYHPAFLLRTDDPDRREAAFEALVADLRAAHERAQSGLSAPCDA